MTRKDPQFNLRMPAELKDLVEQSAKTSGRSMNTEIVSRLKESYEVEELIKAEIESDPVGYAIIIFNEISKNCDAAADALNEHSAIHQLINKKKKKKSVKSSRE